MVASILQLAATGLQDVYLSSNPQSSTFKYAYYRYINFATDTIGIPLNANVTWGKKISVVIPKNGHLLSKLSLHIKLPRLQNVDGTYVCWCDAIGYAIFKEPIELQIGGVVVDRLYPTLLDILDELTCSTKRIGKNLMILKSDNYRSALYNAEKDIDLIIPLDFWFTKDYSMALPLLSMNSQEIQLNFNFIDFNKAINYDGNIGANITNILDSTLYAEYIFLDESVLDTFQEKEHMYVIEQTVYNGKEIVSEDTVAYNTKINFNSPLKEILFVCKSIENLDNNNYFNYSNQNGDSIITDASLLLNGKHRFNNGFLPEVVFRESFPYNVHSVVPTKHLYIMPFSLKPEWYAQPSGAVNLSRFDEVNMALKIKKNSLPFVLDVYGIVHNVVKIQDGMMTFEWLNI